MADKKINGEAKGLNGFAIRRWSDLVSLFSVLVVLVGAITFNIALRADVELSRNDITTLQAQVGLGILPRAEERIEDLERDVEELKQELRLLREK